jgi:thioredoxin 1
MSVINVTLDNFAEEIVTYKDSVVFIDVWAGWCGPCKMISPIYDKLSEEYSAKFTKINIDENQDLAVKLGIRAIPTFLAVKDGKVIDRLIGAHGLQEFIKNNAK